MGDLTIGTKSVITQSGSDEPVLASTLTGSPALAVTNTTGVLPTGVTGTHLAKAWVNFNGTSTVAIRDSLGVSSLTDNGTGNYSVNLSTAISADSGSWSDANHNGMCVASANNDASLCSAASCRFTSETAITCLSSNYSTYIYAGLYDNTQIFVVVFAQ